MSQDPEQRVPCGLYRATRSIGERLTAPALVFFHNHGDPGPGVYLPQRWQHNRAVFAERGITVPDDGYADSLQPLLPEGFYRVVQAFTCCAQACVQFEPDQLVQLGYNGRADPLLFLPQLGQSGVTLPERGTRVDDDRLARLQPLKLARAPERPPDGTLN